MRALLPPAAVLLGGCLAYAPPAPMPRAAAPRPRPVCIVARTPAARPAAAALAAAFGRRPELAVGLLLDPDARLRPLAFAADDERAARAAELVRESEKRLNKLDLTAARSALANARSLLGPAAAEPAAFDAWLGLETAAALADLADDRPDAARAHFGEVARLQPEFELDRRRAPPEAVAVQSQARADMARLARGRVRVDGPAAARVIVDGRERGPAPVELELPVGPHFVTLARPGHRASAAVVEVSAGREAVVAPPLRPAAAAAAAVDARRALALPGAVPVDALFALARALDVGDLVLASAAGAPQLYAAGAARSLPTEPDRAATAVSGLLAAPPPVAFRGVTDDRSADRAWYRKWWNWLLLGALGVLVLRAA